MKVGRFLVCMFLVSPLLSQQSELPSNRRFASQDGLLEGLLEPVESVSAASAAHEFIIRAKRRGAPKHDLEKLSEFIQAAAEFCEKETDRSLAAVWEAEIQLALQLLRQADHWTRTYVSLWLFVGEAEMKPRNDEDKEFNPGSGDAEDGNVVEGMARALEKESIQWAEGEAILAKISRKALQKFKESPSTLSPAAETNLHAFLSLQENAFAHRASHVQEALALVRRQAELRRKKVNLRGSLFRSATPESRLLSSQLGRLRQSDAREAHKAAHYAFVCSRDGSLPEFVYHLLRSNGAIRVYED